MNDWELIQNYCRNGSESAFETLVKRHVDFVYCAALRHVRDPSLAEDVSQAVFLLLARKARSFRSGTVVVSWLFRTTHHIAARALRSDYRRQRRELEAVTMNPQTTSSETDHKWENIAPVLDDALSTLSATDRDAVLLRFISRKPFSQVGTEIGVSEDAAKKRVSRALARLREFFLQRGTTLSIAAIAAILGERIVQAAPATLATKITVGLGASTSSIASPSVEALLKTALRELFWRKVRFATAVSACVMVALLLVNTAVRSAHRGVTIPTPEVVPVQNDMAVGPRKALAEKSANQNAASRRLSLLVERVEDRQPVSGARVLVESIENRGRIPIVDSTTDQQGSLDILVPTHDFTELLVWVSAEGRVPMVMKWQEHEFNNESGLSYTLLLESGQIAAGTVIDESGNPVQGAKVRFGGPGIDLGKRENREFNPELSASYTDAKGLWATTQLPTLPSLEQVTIRVTQPDFTPTERSVSGLPGFPTNGLIVLTNGVALDGRILAEDGTPVPNAFIAKQSGTYLNKRTDADGRFFWPHIEPGQVFLDVEAAGFGTTHELVWATNATNVCELRLKKSSTPLQSYGASEAPRTRLRGTVVDAGTGEPIPSFKVLVGLNGAPFRAHSGGEAVLHGARLLGEGQDGRFDWQVQGSDSFRLQIEAEGYLESVSEQRNYGTDQEFSFKLRRGTILIGRVMTPEGAAAENAVVSLTGPGIGPVMQRPGQLVDPNPGFEATRTRTDVEGKFRLKLKTGARGVAVIHESGCALLTFAATTNQGILLQPWGAVDGTLYLNGQPAPNQRVSVTGCQMLDADPSVLFSFTYLTTTGPDGHFRFDRVLPGNHSVAREVGFFDQGPSVINADHAAKVKVENGAVTSVELRREGRPVIAHLILQGSPDEVHWGESTATLSGEKSFPLALSRDGAIHADDVPPGTYRLSVQLEGASVDPLNSPRPPFGSLQEDIVVPSADDMSVPVDLGALTIKRAN
jgi:RNA polymerase sigma factor (sigma-70 family)